MAWDLVVFDNDGVLVDSERLANQVLAGLLTELGCPRTFEECVASYLGGTIERVRYLVEEQSGRSLPADFEDRYHRDLFAAFDAGLVAVPGIATVLDRLEDSRTPFCVASSGSRLRIQRALRLVGLWNRFEGRVFSAEEVARGKPAPDLFLHAAASLGADPAASVVVEDSPLGVEAAMAAGMSVVGFAAVTPPERLERAGAVVTTMAEAGALISAGPPLVASTLTR